MKITTLSKMTNMKLMNLQLIKIDMKKICFIAISLFCSMVVSAQKFLSSKEMLKMMSREYAAACNEMSKVPGYKKIDLCDGTAFYKNCTADVLSLASNPDLCWVSISNAKIGLSTCVSICYYPGDMDVYRVETIVYGKNAAQGWISQLREMGYKTSKTSHFGRNKEWEYKKSGEDCVFTLQFHQEENEYLLRVFNPNYLYPGS